jgi:signal transduction histidine kinase
MAIELADNVGEFVVRAPVVVPALLVALLAATVVVRRAAPFVAYVVNGLALGLYVWIGYPGDVYPVTNVLVLYTLAVHGSRRQALVGLLAACAGVSWYFALSPLPSDTIDVLVVAATWLITWVVGTATADRRREQAEDERARERQAAEVVAQERARMARELHDIVGHSMNVMVMHAGAARRLVDRDPDAVATALRTIESTGRRSLDELDHLLGLLREGGSAPHAPTAGIEGLADLCRDVAGPGLEVSLHVDHAIPTVPAAVGLAVYRVVQEALTNVVKHADATTVDVHLRFTGTHVDVEIADDGRGPPGGAMPGRGLLGLTERVEALGGTLITARRPGGGHRVHCVLPRPPAP